MNDEPVTTSALTGMVAPLRKHDTPAWVFLSILMWGIVMSLSMVGVWRYKVATGAVGIAAPREWPTVAGFARDPNRAQVLLFAHPKCPCTRASLAELAVLMARLGDSARATVLFMQPPGADEGWVRSDTWDRASRIPGVRAVVDQGSALGERFGAVVSGHTVVYDRAGHLVFEGGITPARGHEGDSLGQSRILSAILSGSSGPSHAPTFGCNLKDPESVEGGGS